MAQHFRSSPNDQEDSWGMVRSWILQLLFQHEEGYVDALEVHDARGGQKATQPDLLNILQRLVGRISECTLIADGLDECRDAPTDVRKMLQDIQKAVANSHTRVLIVSRDNIDIRSGLSMSGAATFSEYRIVPEDVSSDIWRFSKSMVDTKLANKEEKLRDHLAQRMTDKCQGMFLWVQMLGNDINGGINRKKLERIVDSTPTDLDHVYDSHWSKLETHRQRNRGLSILRWVAFAIRPLTIEELTEALLIIDEDGQDSLDIDDYPDAFDNEYVDIQILEVCGSLLEVRQPTDNTEGTSNDFGQLTVHLVHFSAREYVSTRLPVPTGLLLCNAGLQVSREASHKNFLAKLCLRYILLENTWQDACILDGHVEQDLFIPRTFRRYACSAWLQHRTLDGPGYEEVTKLVKSLFDQDNPNFDSWRTSYLELDSESRLAPDGDLVEPSVRLVLAAKLGLRDLVVHLLDTVGLDLDHADELDRGRTALMEACESGHMHVARDLLDRGAKLIVAKDGRTPLMSAIMSGSKELAQLLISRGADGLDVDEDGWTALHYAALYGHGNVVKSLIESGHDVNFTDMDGISVLARAARAGRFEIVELLLQVGASVDLADHDGNTPLLAIDLREHAECLNVVQRLVNHGGNPNARDQKGLTLLHKAAYFGEQALDIVQYLISAEANIEAQDVNGDTPLSYAAMSGSAETVQVLLQSKANPNTTNQTKQGPLSHAAYYGHDGVVQILLDYGAEPNARDEYGDTPLIDAVSKGFTEVVQTLLKFKADPNARDEYGNAPLIDALSKDSTEVVQALLKFKADPNAADKEGRGALSLASFKGHDGMVQILLDTGAEPNARDEYGCTPLIYAALSGSTNTVRVLLRYGADVDAVDMRGQSSLYHAILEGFHNVVKELLYCDGMQDLDELHTFLLAAAAGHHALVRELLDRDKDANLLTERGDTATHLIPERGHSDAVGKIGNCVLNTKPTAIWALFLAVDNGHVEVVRELPVRGWDMNGTNILGWTALMLATNKGHINVVRELLERGANPDFTDNNNWTALMHAACFGHIEMVRELAERGANLNISSRSGITSLILAAAEGHDSVVRELLERGADIDFTDDTNWTALMHAAHHGHIQVVRELAERGADLNIVNRSGETALAVAAAAGHDAMVNELIARSADLTKKGFAGWTPVIHAAARGRDSVLHALIEADRSQPSYVCPPCGLTPLSAAVANEEKSCVRALLNLSEVDLHTKDAFGRTPLWWARSTGNTIIEEMLIQEAVRRGEILSLDGASVVSQLIPKKEGQIYCDYCSRYVQRLDCYNCSICCGGDFDTCEACFLVGARCLDTSHSLKRWSELEAMDMGTNQEPAMD